MTVAIVIFLQLHNSIFAYIIFFLFFLKLTHPVTPLFNPTCMMYLLYCTYSSTCTFTYGSSSKFSKKSYQIIIITLINKLHSVINLHMYHTYHVYYFVAHNLIKRTFSIRKISVPSHLVTFFYFSTLWGK